MPLPRRSWLIAMTDLARRINTARYALSEAARAVAAGDEYTAKLFAANAKRCLKGVRCPSRPKTSNPARKGHARASG